MSQRFSTKKSQGLKYVTGQFFKILICLQLFHLCNFQGNLAYGQCKADSVVSYRVVAGQREIAGIEYFSYDTKDSLINTKFIDYQNGIPTPVYEAVISYSKSKGKILITFENSNWDPERAYFSPTFTTVKTYSKKGLLLSEVNSNGDLLISTDSKIQYSYNDLGELINYELHRWHPVKRMWVIESMISYSYQNGKMSESITSVWDTVGQTLNQSWRTDFIYNADLSLAENTTYQFNNNVWIPDSKTTYGYDTSQNVKGNVVQKWNGAKGGWDNKFYYVFKLNEKGQTDAEIHLSWSGTDWVIDLTFFYVYNESGQLIQILNDKKEIMIDRFCR